MYNNVNILFFVNRINNIISTIVLPQDIVLGVALNNS